VFTRACVQGRMELIKLLMEYSETLEMNTKGWRSVYTDASIDLVHLQQYGLLTKYYLDLFSKKYSKISEMSRFSLMFSKFSRNFEIFIS